MRASSVVLSTVLHLGLAASLVTVAEKKGLGKKTISVAVTGEEKKKKEEAKPPPPKPIARPAPPKVTAVAKAEAPVAAKGAGRAPVVTNLAMSNSDLDVGPGIGLQGRATKPAAAPAPVKVASAISEARNRRARQEVEGGEAAPCEEEPTKPEAVVKGTLDYTIYPQAQADGIEGKFKARITVDESGEVVKVEVLAGIEPGFDAALVAALQKWRFKPAMACGKPVPGGTFVVSRTFELGD